MSIQNILTSKLSVHFSILIGKYLPKKWGYGFASALGSFIGSVPTWDINRNIRANQYVVQGETLNKKELIQSSKNVLTHAGHCYYDFHHYIYKPDELEDLVPWTDQMQEFIDITSQGQGYLVVAPHISNFDLVASRLVRGGYTGIALSYPNPGSGYQLQNEIRKSYGLKLSRWGDPETQNGIIEYLKSGGVIGTGIDRPLPTRKKRHYVNFFGRPSPLPLGHITTALAANVPILVVAAYLLPDGRYSFKYSGPIHLQKFANKMDNIILNAEIILKEIEEFIKLAPEQWLMYYPVWPDILELGL